MPAHIASDSSLSIYEIKGLLSLVEFLETQSKLLIDFNTKTKEERKDIRRDIPSLKNVKHLVQTLRSIFKLTKTTSSIYS
jgi:hypothetical protein